MKSSFKSLFENNIKIRRKKTDRRKDTYEPSFGLTPSVIDINPNRQSNEKQQKLRRVSGTLNACDEKTQSQIYSFKSGSVT